MIVSSAPQAMAVGLRPEIIIELEKQNLGRVIVDPHTGLAAGGFDPVAYFLNKVPVQGNPRVEATFTTATYRFVSSANRDVFLRSPLIYQPRFGGRGAMQMARGLAVEGNPKVWAIFKNRLFFFHSVALRNEWLTAPDGFAAQAEIEWKKQNSIRKSFSDT